ncbi:MAG: tetratricopeptide repeat protein [Oculatellaceae cyanobacterium bins.114]|nr:tetratricopeptide repeat protein [Oculatellaceae cyanobacterium bins.114]
MFWICNEPHQAVNLSNLATLHRSQERYTEAKPLLLRSVSILQKQLGVNKSRTAKIVSNLALLYDLQGHYREAESLYLQTLPVLSNQPEESHSWRQEALQRFRSLLQNATQEQRTNELSNDPMTQEMLKQLQATTED